MKILFVASKATCVAEFLNCAGSISHIPTACRSCPACRCEEADSLCMTGSYFLLPMAQTTLAITTTGCLLRLLRAMSDYTAERVRLFFPDCVYDRASPLMFLLIAGVAGFLAALSIHGLTWTLRLKNPFLTSIFDT